MGVEKLFIDYPLVDDNFNSLEGAEDFAKKVSDEFQKFEVTIKVESLKMASTAIFFSLKPRLNVDFIVELEDFAGSSFVHSFLKSGHIKEIKYERQA